MQDLPYLKRMPCDKCGKPVFLNCLGFHTPGYICFHCNHSHHCQPYLKERYFACNRAWAGFRSNFINDPPSSDLLNDQGISPYTWDPLYQRLCGFAGYAMLDDLREYENNVVRERSVFKEKVVRGNVNIPCLIYPMATIPTYIEGHYMMAENGKTAWVCLSRRKAHHPSFVYFKAGEKLNRKSWTTIYENFYDYRADLYRHLLIDAPETLAVKAPEFTNKSYKPTYYDFSRYNMFLRHRTKRKRLKLK
jgi:hypothetical protein